MAGKKAANQQCFPPRYPPLVGQGERREGGAEGGRQGQASVRFWLVRLTVPEMAWRAGVELTAGELQVTDVFIERKAAELHPFAHRRQITPEKRRTDMI